MVKVNYQVPYILGKSLDLSSRLVLNKSFNIEHAPEDRISQLPEEILVLILSFLTIKEAAQTSALSSRWITLWKHTLRLDFDDRNTLGKIADNPKILKRERRKYVSWVNHVLYSHKRPTLDEFRVSFCLGKISQNEIDKWLEYAFARRVKRLELSLSLFDQPVQYSSGSYAFPGRLISLGYLIHHNAFIDFNSLKELRLKSVDVTGEAVECLLFKCPFLERLVVSGSGKLVNLKVSGPQLMLKYLEIIYCLNVASITICNSNLVSLTISKVEKLMVADNPMLAEVHIHGCFPSFPLYVFSQLSCCISQLEVLMLRTDAPKKIAKLKGVPELSTLKELIISVGVWRDGGLIKCTSFLKSCPNLQKFALQLCWLRLPETNGELEKATKCSLKHLKVLELSGYYGHTCEVELVMYLLENAVGLERIIVDPQIQEFSLAPHMDFDEEQAARICATKRLVGLVPRHIELVFSNPVVFA